MRDLIHRVLQKLLMEERPKTITPGVLVTAPAIGHGTDRWRTGPRRRRRREHDAPRQRQLPRSERKQSAFESARKTYSPSIRRTPGAA